MKKEVFLDYYLPWVIGIGIACAVAIWLIADAIRAPKPDYFIGYVCAHRLSDETVAAITQAVAAYGEDVNENGEVLVALNQYLIRYDGAEANPYEQAAGVSALSVDLKKTDFVCIIVENADRFIESCDTVLTLSGKQLTNRTNPDDVSIPWSASPVLSAVSLSPDDAAVLNNCRIVITQTPGASLLSPETRTEADTRLFEALCATP